MEQDSTVAVAVRGIEYLSGIKLPVWSPAPRWVFGLGAEHFSTAHPAGAGVLFDNVRVSSGYLHPNHQAPLRLSFNGQQCNRSPRIRIHRLPYCRRPRRAADQHPAIRGLHCTAKPWHWLSEVLSLWQPHGRRNLTQSQCDRSPSCTSVLCTLPESNVSNPKLELSLNVSSIIRACHASGSHRCQSCLRSARVADRSQAAP